MMGKSKNIFLKSGPKVEDLVRSTEKISLFQWFVDEYGGLYVRIIAAGRNWFDPQAARAQDQRYNANVAVRLRHNPVMRRIVGGKAAVGRAASARQMGRFETRWLTVEKNLSVLARRLHHQTLGSKIKDVTNIPNLTHFPSL